MGFRDESEAARVRIETLERALESAQRTLEAVRAELDVERASQVAPSVLAAQRSEIEALKARLEVRSRYPMVEREPPPRALREPLSRTARSALVVIAFSIVALFGTLAGLRLSGNAPVGRRLRAIATCVDQLRSGRADPRSGEPVQSVQPRTR